MRSEEEFGLGAVFLPPTESLHHHLSCKCRSHLPQRLSSGFNHHRQVNRVSLRVVAQSSLRVVAEVQPSHFLWTQHEPWE